MSEALSQYVTEIVSSDVLANIDEAAQINMPYMMERSCYQSSILAAEDSSSEMHKAVESRPKPRYIDSSVDRLAEDFPPPPPPSPVSWRREKSDRR